MLVFIDFLDTSGFGNRNCVQYRSGMHVKLPLFVHCWFWGKGGGTEEGVSRLTVSTTKREGQAGVPYSSAYIPISRSKVTVILIGPLEVKVEVTQMG